MEVKCGDFVIKGDAQCCWIEKVTVGETLKGKPKVSYKNVTGYYPNLNSLMKAFADKQFRSSDATKAKDHLRDIDKCMKCIIEMVDAVITEVPCAIIDDYEKKKAERNKITTSHKNSL